MKKNKKGRKTKIKTQKITKCLTMNCTFSFSLLDNNNNNNYNII
jgi:hypothetical protein